MPRILTTPNFMATISGVLLITVTFAAARKSNQNNDTTQSNLKNVSMYIDTFQVKEDCSGMRTEDVIEILPKFYIAVTCHNCVDTIRILLEKMSEQTYSNFEITVADDGSTDGSTDSIRTICSELWLNCNILRSSVSHGPSFSKWRLFKHFKDRMDQGTALPNDFVMVLDGDDYLLDKHVLRDFGNELMSTGAWVLFGAIRGQYGWQCKPVSKKIWPLRVCNNKVCRLREPWAYCHPRTLKLGLLKYFYVSDFRFPKDDSIWGNLASKWLPKMTDRTWLFKAIEVSGPDRVKHFLKRAVVYYRSTDQNTNKIISQDIQQMCRKFTELTPVFPIRNMLHIVTVIHNRIANLKDWILANTVSQSMLKTHNIVLHIGNNNKKKREAVDSIISTFDGKVQNLDIFVYHQKENQGPILRYAIETEVFRRELVDYIITIDDDIFMKARNGLQKIWDQRKTKAHSCFYGKLFEEGADYWDPINSKGMYGIIHEERKDIDTWHYCGAGLSVIDANFWRIWESHVKKIPRKWYFVEDLWSSYLLYIANWGTPRLWVPQIVEGNPRKRKHHNRVALWSTKGVGQAKSNFMLWLRKKCGWEIGTRKKKITKR